MANGEDDGGQKWISTLAAGGLPQILAGPAGKAISRLIGASVEIPAAYLEGISQEIRDKAEARSLVSRALAEKAAEAATNNPEVMERAAKSMLARAYRIQANKESVAAAAVKELKADPPSPTSTGPSEDWMNNFERYAEDASGADFQEMWGRVLAGEVRRPGRYSKRTLRFLSEVSQADAVEFERISKIAFGDFIPVSLAKPEGTKDISALISLENNGLLQGSMTPLVRSQTLDENGYGFTNEGDVYLVFRGEPNSRIDYSVVLLTSLGRELLTVLPGRDVWQAATAVGKACRSDGISECHIGVRENEEGVRLKEVIWISEESL